MGALHGGRILKGGYVPTDIQIDETSVIGIVGTANIATADKPTKNDPQALLNDTEYLDYFGTDAAGFSLTRSVEEIYRECGKYRPIIVFVNVYDPDVHTGGVSDVTISDIVGGIDATTKKRKGIHALLDAKATLNITPKILIAPGYAYSPSVSAALSTVADQLRAVYYIDSEIGKTVAEVIAERTTIGKAFNTSDKRCSCLYPYLKGSGGFTNPFSLYAAAMRARTDLEFGFWYSISSKQLKTVIGVERGITYKIDSESCEANQLNIKGIVTYKNVSGIRVNGNWNASYPTNTQPDQFEAALRTGDVIDESIIRYMEQKIDQPIYRGDDASLIDDVINDVNAFLNKLRGAGAILGGVCWYEPNQNNPTDIASGKIAWSFDFAATPPLNTFTFYRYNNVEYYQKLGA